jgi:hypothetical protein
VKKKGKAVCLSLIPSKAIVCPISGIFDTYPVSRGRLNFPCPLFQPEPHGIPAKRYENRLEKKSKKEFPPHFPFD